MIERLEKFFILFLLNNHEQKLFLNFCLDGKFNWGILPLN